MPDGATGELELDREQRDAVEAAEPAIAVLAGPGSGKTRVLSYRARHLLSTDSNAKALLLTFTNKAAAEMKARAIGVAIVTTDRLVASTYHTFSMRLLQAHGDLVGVERDFEIIDEGERAEVAQSAANAAGTTDRSNRWSYLRLRRYEAHEAEVVAFGAAYQQRKRELAVLDFDDVLVHAVELLEGNPEIAEALGRRHAHILIDEFQDTNPVQFALVRALWRHAQTVSVFADDDQGIYQFAGAEPGNIRGFIDELSARRYSLTTNYRCRSRIVAKANRLIARDPEASGRQMRSYYEGGEVRSRGFSDLEQEGSVVGDEIASLIEEGTERPDEIAVLARRRTRLSAILERLADRGVPVSNWLGAAFETSERQALTTCLYVVRATLTERQRTRLCNLLSVEIPEEPQVDALLTSLEPEVPAVGALIQLRELVWQGAPVLDVVDKAREALLLMDESWRDGLDQVRDAVDAFQAHDSEFGIDQLLAELALGGIHGAPTTGGGVKVASLHRTKGLQWRRVYLVGLEDGTLPDYRADTPGLLSEERRTCFVGVCRAEEYLTLTRVRILDGWSKQPSPFLAEMGFTPPD